MPIEKTLYAGDSAPEEAELEFDQLLLQFKEWKKNNDGDFDKFLNDRRVKLSDGGRLLSRKLMIHMLKNEYPKEYNNINTNDYSDKQLQELLNNLDVDGVPF